MRYALIRVRWFILGSFLIVATLCEGATAAEKIFTYPVHVETLANGLKVVSIEFDSPGLVAYFTVVRAGSRNEVEPGKSGFAHFFDHMMFRGTENVSSEEYNEILKRIGSDSNAFTTDDWTGYHILASADGLETIMRLESDRFLNLSYSEEDFQKEAGAVLGEYRKNYSSPFLVLFEELHDNAYTTHTYKHTTMGFLEDIKAMPEQYEYSLTFFDRYYRPENCILLVVGDFDQEQLMALAEKYYGSWEQGDYVPEIPVEGPQTEEKTAHVDWANPTLPYLVIGYHAPAFDDSKIDMPALDVLSQLVFSANSPLYHKLVVETQMVEFIAGGAPDHRDPSLFTIMTRIKDPGKGDEVREAIYSALEDAKSTPVDEERLASIKSHLKYSFAMGLSTPMSVARTMGWYLNLTGDTETVNRVYAMYDKVTAEDIQRVANEYFRSEDRTVVTLSYTGGEQ